MRKIFLKNYFFEESTQSFTRFVSHQDSSCIVWQNQEIIIIVRQQVFFLKKHQIKSTKDMIKHMYLEFKPKSSSSSSSSRKHIDGEKKRINAMSYKTILQKCVEKLL